MSFPRPRLATLASAVLYVLAFAPYGAGLLSLVALVPWLVSQLRRPSVAQGLWLGSLITLLGFHWVAYVLQQFASLPMPVALLGLVLFSLIGQPQLMLFAWFAPRLRDRLSRAGSLQAVAWLVLAALTYTALDYLVPKLFRDTLGHSWSTLQTLRLNARWMGAYGLTFLAALSNLALAWLATCLLDRGEPSVVPALRRSGPGVVLAAAALAAAFLQGASTRGWLKGLLASPQAALPLAVIQANIGDIEKLAAESGVRQARKKVLNTFFELSDQALQRTPRPQALIWPETSYPTTYGTPDFADDLELDGLMQNFTRSRGISLFFGGYDQEKRIRRDYNALFFLSAEAALLRTYRKNRLLLFGEEMPFAEVFPALRRWFPQVGNFGRGEGPVALEVPTLPVSLAAPAICYEVLFAEDMIAAKRKGAQWILNITNDSWFGPHAEPELHLALATFRSIENGIPMVRSTNTGISAWVDALGEIHQPTPKFEPAVLSLELPIVQIPAGPVERWGDWFPKLSLFSLLFWAWLAWTGVKRLDTPKLRRTA